MTCIDYTRSSFKLQAGCAFTKHKHTTNNKYHTELVAAFVRLSWYFSFSSLDI